MDAIRIGVTGDRQVALRFEEFPEALYEELRAEIARLTAELLARVEASTPVRTGQLQAEERGRLFTDADRITGYVDIAGKGAEDFAKAGALEYGAHGAARVKAHRMRLDHAWGQLLAAPELVMVAAYTRTANIAEVAFERGPLAAMGPETLEALNAVVEKAVARADG